MKIGIVRHGQAVPGADLDGERRLTEQGKQEVEQLAIWLAEQVNTQPFSPSFVMASPYFRAQQTAEILARHLALPVKTHAGMTPSGDAKLLVDEWCTRLEQDCLLVSHMPLVGRLTSLLTEGIVSSRPWLTAECQLLQGSLMAAGCLSLTKRWYPDHSLVL